MFTVEVKANQFVAVGVALIVLPVIVADVASGAPLAGSFAPLALLVLTSIVKLFGEVFTRNIENPAPHIL